MYETMKYGVSILFWSTYLLGMKLQNFGYATDHCLIQQIIKKKKKEKIIVHYKFSGLTSGDLMV